MRSAGFPAAISLELAAPAAADAADALLQATGADATALQAAFATALAEDDREVRRALQRRFAQPELELALRWQNPGALDGSIAWLRRQSPELWNRRMRESERLAGRFLQRYTLKNDSIGFFGPLAWAQLDRSTTTALTPGVSLSATQSVRLEAWCVDVLLAGAEADAGAERSIAPWRLPGFYLDGDRAVFPARAALGARLGLEPALAASPVDEDLREVLALCDGSRRAGEIATLLDGGVEEVEVVRRLCRLRDLGLVGFRLELPLSLHPERSLRTLVAGLDEPVARARLHARVGPTLDAYDEIVAAGRDPQLLATGVARLEAAFAATSGRASRRAAGQTYAGRTLVHMDAVRDIELRLGGELLAALGPPLTLVLTSARWFTATFAAKLLGAFVEIHSALAGGYEAAVMPLQAFAPEVLPLIVDDAHGIRAALSEELQRRWQAILQPDLTASARAYRTADLACAVAEAFPASGPGWQLARYVSPDVLVAARDVAALAEGSFTLVLGEVHLYNTVSRQFFLEAHPDPEALFKARDLDIPGTCVLPVPSKRFNLPRIAVGLASPRDVWFVYEDAPTGLPAARMVALGELVVEAAPQGLTVRTRDSRFACPVIEFFAHTIANAGMAFPPLLPPAPHTPRIVVDRLVLQRETWLIEPDELEAPRVAGERAPDRAERFLNARRLRRQRGLPRRVFARTATEKPVCVDFDSPILADILGHLASGASPGEVLCAVELLPDLDVLWLSDATDQRYTSELRLVALDPASPGWVLREGGARASARSATPPRGDGGRGS